MAAVAFTPVTGSVGFLDGTALSYETAPAVFCTEAKVSGAKRDIRPVYAPGELGAETKNFGGGEKHIHLELIYIGTSEDTCRSAFKSDCDSLSAGTFSMAMGSDAVVFDGCYLSGQPEGNQPRSTGFSTFHMKASMAIICVRP